MISIGAVDSSKMIHQDRNERHWIRAITRDDDDTVRQILRHVPTQAHHSNLLNVHLQLHPEIPSIMAICDHYHSLFARDPLVLGSHIKLNQSHERFVRVWSKLFASYIKRQQYVSRSGGFHFHRARFFLWRTGIENIKNLIVNDGYGKLQLTENGDGLRPLQLAGHLGTLVLLMYLSETPGIIITREEEHIVCKLQF